MTRTAAQDVYTGFDHMPIAGEWRAGGAGRSRPNTDPYTGEVLLETTLADARDLDEAYRAARVARSVADGAELVLTGEPTGPTGQVLPPQVLLGDTGKNGHTGKNGDNTVTTAKEEVFGPVATVIAADGEEDALRLANDTEYGLSSGVYTRDVERGLRFALRVQAGMTHVNDTTVHDDAHIAFGGEKNSGLGRFGGDWVVDEFTTQHWVSVQHAPREFRY
ncbi:aldehyde dehydrogenase family protein [Streptomyces zagrosensis]|uniref:Acyl-CoA reductase-like NAD-dependent aldehyde dehydrogenase n=1 Tax=Streptomyces zagrosensis TaxID=1042984 RepID=A0A7W9QGG3_9ACTN|nr:aldehyde dehydrogenase family protein [Streptomyces zagrosensis]MBB5939788.1 acyl-CoA reductase-like NAD-dependent aldehyde dehydrogenase [Streptomyces zagrosensis]